MTSSPSAAELAQLNRYARAIGKEGFYKQVEEKQSEAYRLMAEAISYNAVAPDGREGMTAFAEKRAPVWKKVLGPARQIGGSEGIRTPYLLSAIQALSQLSYGPTCSSR